MTINPVEIVKQAKTSSELIKSICCAKEAIPGLRVLTYAEIDQLKRQGNLTTGDWSNILVTPDFTPRRIWQNTFFGKVQIGIQTDGI